jgi:hypothetical protein
VSSVPAGSRAPEKNIFTPGVTRKMEEFRHFSAGFRPMNAG